MKRVALIDISDNVVKNIIQISDDNTSLGEDAYIVPAGHRIIDDPDGKAVIGLRWLSNHFEEPEPIEPIVTVPIKISHRQFYQQLSVLEIITKEEALAAVKTGTIPAALMQIVDALPEAMRFSAEMLLSGAVEFQRDHELTSAVGAAYGWNKGQIDDFFIEANKL